MVGVVEKIGSSVSSVLPGDRVTVNAVSYTHLPRRQRLQERVYRDLLHRVHHGLLYGLQRLFGVRRGLFQQLHRHLFGRVYQLFQYLHRRLYQLLQHLHRQLF